MITTCGTCGYRTTYGEFCGGLCPACRIAADIAAGVGQAAWDALFEVFRTITFAIWIASAGEFKFHWFPGCKFNITKDTFQLSRRTQVP